MPLDSIAVRKPVNIRAWAGWWLLVLVASILWESRLQADTSKPLSAIIRQLLTERLLSTTAASPLQENRITPAHVRVILHDRLDPGLLDSVMETTGTDFRFTQPGQNSQAQAAVLVLSYPDEKTAGSMMKRLANRGGYFQRTKLLTRFSYAQIDNRLLIVFTENAGDQDLVRFIDEFPELIKEVYK